MPTLYQCIAEATAYLRQGIAYEPIIGLILGSGLGELAGKIEEAAVFPYDEVPHFPASTVDGHSNRLVIGQLAGKTVMAMQGRAHFYEGYSMAEVTFPVRVMHALGVRVLIATNAAGGLNPAFRAGDLMLITDHINLPGMAGHSPLLGPYEPALGARFPSMHAAYDRDLIQLALEIAAESGTEITSGVYVMVSGPSYETPAELRFLRLGGADAVGMSTAPEVVVANQSGMRVLGISAIGNAALDHHAEMISHEEVLAATARLQPRFQALVMRIIERI